MELDNFIQKFSGFSEPYSFYNGEVELIYDKVNHIYMLVEGDNLVAKPSVTKIVKESVDKTEILIPWGCKMMGEKMTRTVALPISTYDELDKLIRSSKGAHREKLDEAGAVGNLAHNWIEQYIKNKLVAGDYFMKYPDDQRAVNAIKAALDWMKAHNVRWICTERKIYSRIHQYAGTMDGMAYTDSCSDPLCCPKPFKGRRSIVDWKTSNNLYLDYLFQEAAYRGAYLEEHPDEKIDDGWVIRLGKEDAEFDPWHIWNEEEFEMYYYGFLNARRWWESMEHAKEQVKKKEQTLRIARKELKQKQKEENSKIKCKGADKYKGIRKPVCNDGMPCETCLAKYKEQHPWELTGS